MPELPDITVYIESLHSRIAGRKLTRIRLVSPFLLRTYEPRIEALFGRRVEELRRVGKRIVFCLQEEYFLVLHLMIAGRLHWKRPGAGVPGKIGLCALDFENGSLVLTESGSRRRASLHVVRGADELKAFDPRRCGGAANRFSIVSRCFVALCPYSEARAHRHPPFQRDWERVFRTRFCMLRACRR